MAEEVVEQTASVLWEQACEHLQKVLHTDVYSRWIAIIESVSVDESSLELRVDNDFYRTWLEENYLPLIVDAVSAASGKTLKITFSVRTSSEKENVPVVPPIRRGPRIPLRRKVRKNSEEAHLNSKFTFDDFVVGPSNSFAHAAALAVAQAPGTAYNPLFMYGDTGLGKTHLMQAIGHYALEKSDCNVTYLSSETLLNDYVNALQNRSLVEFRAKYRSIDVLLIDDIHFLAGKERIQEEFFHTFNALFDARKQIIMTSDRPAREISGLEQRLVSRFEWGLVTELERPDFETRLAILRYKQSRSSATLGDNLLTFIAENVQSNVRRLEGALIRSLSYSSLTKSELTLDTLKTLLKDTLDQEQEEDLSLNEIMRCVAEHYDLRMADLTSKRRPRSIAIPRQIAMYLCRRLTRCSLPEIAVSFEKTHATVLHACKAIRDRMDVDESLRRSVHALANKLGRDLAAL